MSEVPVKRLSKVAREFNVSISTIVEYLNDKGYEVEEKPTTKIAGEIYEVLLDEFQSEKEVKEEAKLVGQKRVKRETISLEDAEKAEEKEHKKEEDEIIIKNMENTAGGEIDEIIKPKIQDKDVTVVGKIDLEKVDPKTAKEQEKKAKEEEEKSKAKEESKAEEKKAEKKKTEAAKAEEKKDAPAKSEEKDDAEVKAKESKTDQDQKDDSKEESKVEETEKESEKEPEKEIELIKAKAKKLEGPKMVGKIELPKEREKKPTEKKKSKDDDDRKRKRKRIMKPTGKVDTKSSQNFKDKKHGHKGKKKKKHDEKAEISKDEIRKKIAETQERLRSVGKSKGSKHRKAKRDAISQQKEQEMLEQEQQEKVLQVTEFVTVSELANMMDVSVNDVISACMSLGLFVSINQRLDAETLGIVAEEFGYSVEFASAEVLDVITEEEDDEKDLEPRPPIVTVMGHVDHGKTSLLDYIRKTNVIEGEAGGITQHIGAYNVKVGDGKSITFLDTPGHEAFTAMRARGAQVTDCVIIVIAADDNVMPQTKEAINHAQAAGVPMIFAFNKIDKPGANPDKLKEELAAMDILVEDWGGKFQSQDISAKKGTHIDELLEKVILEAELLELKANPNKNAVGTVVESTLDKGRGYVTTLLVQAGTMRIGDVLLAGPHTGRVKAMHNEKGEAIEEAGPSIPVSMLGLSGAASAGDRFHVMDDEKEARQIATKREQLQREQGFRSQKHITLDEIGRRLAIGDFKELNVIVKGDVDGSVEALADSLLKLSTEKIQINVIHKSVGQISESDVLLATASDAIIIGFQVRPSASARKLAEKEEIDLRLYSVIYDAIEEVKAAMEGMLAPKEEEKIVCNLEVRDVFKISKVGTIAGCYVTEGKIHRNTKVRLIRDGIVIYSGELGSLKRFKDNVSEVASGYECGLNIENFNDIKVGDVIEGYEIVEVKQTL